MDKMNIPPPSNYAAGGIVDNAVNYYDGVIKENANRSGFTAGLKSFGAKVGKGLISISGLHEVEKSSGKLGWDVGSGADTKTIIKDGAGLALDTTLAAATFLPAGKAISGLAKGEKLLTTAKAGTKITGLAKGGKAVAGTVADDIGAAISKTIPQGGKVTAENAKSLLGELKTVGQKYGVEIKEGGNIGESVGRVDQILVNTKVGGPHEIAHVAQQLQTRATFLEQKAQSLGKGVKDLTAAEKDEVFQQVKKFESAANNQHEMWAKEATNFGGSAKGNYGQALQQNVDSFKSALAEGTVPASPASLTSRAYGNVPNVVGTTQGQIMKNTGALQAGTVNYQRENH